MISLFLDLKKPIQSVLATQTFDRSLKALNLDDKDWGVLTDISSFFEGFAKPTVRSQADQYPTLQRIVPQFIAILRQLKSFFSADNPIELRMASKAAYKIMHKYYLKSLTNTAACTATILDPRYKDQVFTYLEDSGEDGMQIHTKAMDLSNLTYNRYQTRKSQIDTYQRSLLNAQYQEQSDEEEEDDWRDPFHEFQDIRLRNIRPELDRYLEEPLVSRLGKESHRRVPEYWKSHQFDYPILSQMARDFLAIPATSAPSERVFSQGGDIITRKRNRIGGNNTRYVLCLWSWGMIVEDDDNDVTDELKEEADIVAANAETD